MSSDKFIPTPAGTAIAAPTAVQSFARRHLGMQGVGEGKGMPEQFLLVGR